MGTTPVPPQSSVLSPFGYNAAEGREWWSGGARLADSGEDPPGWLWWLQVDGLRVVGWVVCEWATPGNSGICRCATLFAWEGWCGGMAELTGGQALVQSIKRE